MNDAYYTDVSSHARVARTNRHARPHLKAPTQVLYLPVISLAHTNRRHCCCCPAHGSHQAQAARTFWQGYSSTSPLRSSDSVGGVGKSTFSAQLTFALAAAQRTVGLLDIDICGPSIPKLLGVEVRSGPSHSSLHHRENKFISLLKDGRQFMWTTLR